MKANATQHQLHIHAGAAFVVVVVVGVADGACARSSGGVRNGVRARESSLEELAQAGSAKSGGPAKSGGSAKSGGFWPSECPHPISRRPSCSGSAYAPPSPSAAACEPLQELSSSSRSL